MNTNLNRVPFFLRRSLDAAPNVSPDSGLHKRGAHP